MCTLGLPSPRVLSLHIGQLWIEKIWAGVGSGRTSSIMNVYRLLFFLTFPKYNYSVIFTLFDIVSDLEMIYGTQEDVPQLCANTAYLM